MAGQRILSRQMGVLVRSHEPCVELCGLLAVTKNHARSRRIDGHIVARTPRHELSIGIRLSTIRLEAQGKRVDVRRGNRFGKGGADRRSAKHR